jgi:hypothetical protein
MKGKNKCGDKKVYTGGGKFQREVKFQKLDFSLVLYSLVTTCSTE